MNSGDDAVQTGKTILTALYLCMLGVCFLVPIFFYIRMHCDERRNRHLRDLEIAGMRQAVDDSQIQQREESRAVRRKYREERKARIIQLFAPVRTILTEDNFMSSQTKHRKGTTQNSTEENDSTTQEEDRAPQQLCKRQDELEEEARPQSPDSSSKSGKGDWSEDSDIDEFILVPRPGLPHGAAIYEFNSNTNSFTIANDQDDVELREVPNECSICLCEYEIKSDIVWSSNPQCDHVFHTQCIEQWLMKQRGGPLCPCCRRDFVIDPFDFGSGDFDDLEKGDSSAFARNSDEMISASTPTGSRAEMSSTTVDAVEETVLAMVLAASLASSMERIED